MKYLFIFGILSLSCTTNTQPQEIKTEEICLAPEGVYTSKAIIISGSCDDKTAEKLRLELSNRTLSISGANNGCETNSYHYNYQLDVKTFCVIDELLDVTGFKGHISGHAKINYKCEPIDCTETYEINYYPN